VDKKFRMAWINMRKTSVHIEFEADIKCRRTLS
jgi:hypothetical protein